ncbi:MAG: hypothetical protein AAFU34_14145 [Pseudomonadota bacterium]
MRRIGSKLPALFMLVLSACGLTRCTPDPIDQARVEVLYATPLPPPETPLRVYFMGHSLIGRDMPAMLAQLAEAGHGYESQLGWGAELQAHWGDETLDGADRENDHPRFREAHEAMESGAYDALVMTEKISIRDSIAYHDSWHYMSLWAEKAIAANPEIRLYFYETWHNRDVDEGWFVRIDQDLSLYWEGEIVDRALATDKLDRPVYIIPGGQVMARFLREVEARGGVGNVMGPDDLFKDRIHFNSLGAYLMALTHYAVLYGRPPVGLAHELTDATGAPVPAPAPETARLMQEIVWEVVTGYSRTGVRGTP